MADRKLMRTIERLIDTNAQSPFFKNFLGGPNVRAFEKAFARYVGARYAVSMPNGTLALNAAYTALFVSETLNTHPEAIVSPYTFVATVSELIRSGFTPVFADVEPDGACIDLESIRSLINDKTGLIVPMYPLGSHPNLSEIMHIDSKAYPHGIPVVEDACQALAPNFKLRGRMAVFSFQQTKSLSTGEGGIVVTDWKDGYDRLCYIRNMGCKYGPFKERYAHIISTNYRLTEIQATIALHALKNYNKVVKHQLMLGNVLKEAMEIADWISPQKPWTRNGYIFSGSVNVPLPHMDCDGMQHQPAKEIRGRFLKKVKRWNKGVPGKVIGPGYSELVYELPAFRVYARPCPVAEMWRDHAVWFDIRGYSAEQVKDIARQVETFK